MSGIRNTLHKTKLEAFKTWLDQNEIPHRPGKGDWEVLQVFTEKSNWQRVFERLDMKEHYSVNEKLLPIVRRFIHDSKVKVQT